MIETSEHSGRLIDWHNCATNAVLHIIHYSCFQVQSDTDAPDRLLITSLDHRLYMTCNTPLHGRFSYIFNSSVANYRSPAFVQVPRLLVKTGFSEKCKLFEASYGQAALGDIPARLGHASIARLSSRAQLFRCPRAVYHTVSDVLTTQSTNTSG